ncbi:TPA: hypothetical protein ACX6QM_002267 [Photobacterium damselae]
MKKRGVLVEQETVNAIVESEDCVGLTILSSMLLIKEPIINFAQNIINSNDDYTKDSYWLLLYQLFRTGDIENAYPNRMFDVLLEHDVDFLPANGSITEAEQECNSIHGKLIFGPVVQADVAEEPEF